MRVRRLNPEVTAKLRSGVAINTVAQCVEELVLNSLDASASCVAVRLDLTFFKVQVIDNGRGISQEDLTLVGERYATSKCCTLEDVSSTRTFGHRGEALASIGEISQELTVTTRTNEQLVTYSKSVGRLYGSSRIQRASVQRPSSGTSVTVLNFLYNMPVRQSAVHSVLDVEKVRRDLEVLALSHSNVSFSLYDDASKSWCLRVPRTLSTVKTFGHLFGSAWVPLLRLVDGRRESFRLSGYVAVKGYHNKNLQFVFVDGRRIIDDKLQKTVNDSFQYNFKGDQSCGAGDLQPVYVLNLECPRDLYDVGLHPSKTLIEFHQFDVLKAFIEDIIKSFLEEHVIVQVRTSLEHSATISSASFDSVDDVRAVENAPVITVRDYGKSLHSLPAKRPHRPAKSPYDQKGAGSGIRDLSLIEGGPSIVDAELEQSSSSRRPTVPPLFLPRKPRLREESVNPISVSMAIASERMSLGMFMNISKEEQEKRALDAINELKQRYSYKTYPSKRIKSNVHERTTGGPDDVSLRPAANEPEVVINPIADSFILDFSDESEKSRVVTPMVQDAVQDTSPAAADAKRSTSTPTRTSGVQRQERHKTLPEESETTMLVEQTLIAADPFGHETTPQKITQNCIREVDAGDRHFYLDPSCGNSNFGRPVKRPEECPGSAGNFNLLPLDLFPANSDTKLAARRLPWRPWNFKDRKQLSLIEENINETSSVSKLYQDWENPILGAANLSDCSVMAVKQWSSMIGPFAATSSSCHSYVFSRTILETIQISRNSVSKPQSTKVPSLLCALVCLFFTATAAFLDPEPCTSEPTLVILFDQHAVHERIRLECTLKEAGFSDDGSEQKPKSLGVNPPLMVFLPQEAVRLALQHRVQLSRFVGVDVSPNCDGDGEDTSRTTLLVHSLPSCLLEREASECKQRRPSVLQGLAQALILEVVDDLMMSRASRARIPKVVLDVLKSQACHGAFKFGDRLDVPTCKDLMVQLRKCMLPFQCAHGRPSVTALTDLRRMPRPKQIAKPNLHKLRQMMIEEGYQFIERGDERS